MIWVNGNAATELPVTDRGLLYGDGVWETIGVHQGRPRLFEWHLERLQQGLQVLGMASPDEATLHQEIATACRMQPHAVLKLIVTRGSGLRGYNPRTAVTPTRILQISDWPEPPPEYASAGIFLALCKTRLAHQPRLAGFKHLNRLEQVLARAEFDAGYQEGLMCDYDNNVIEGTMSNLFVVSQDGSVHTPDLTQCGVDGVMRRFFIQKLADSGIECHIRALKLRDVQQAQGLFMTNVLIGLWPVREFSGKTYKILPLMRTLQAAASVLP